MSMRRRVQTSKVPSTEMSYVDLIPWYVCTCLSRAQYLWQEYMLDNTFAKLGIDTECVDHPILMTETLCNPDYSRSRAYLCL